MSHFLLFIFRVNYVSVYFKFLPHTRTPARTHSLKLRAHKPKSLYLIYFIFLSLFCHPFLEFLVLFAGIHFLNWSIVFIYIPMPLVTSVSAGADSAHTV